MANKNWLWLVGGVLLAGIVYAALGPVDWQVRLGLHWLVEHFVVYFAVTTAFCLAWPRPMAVAAVLLPFAVALEAAQMLTPDRVPDFATALSAATGIAVAALLADFVLTPGKRRRSAAAKGRKA
jgi:VanZ family protein